MLRPEVVKQLSCPAVGLATSWSILRKSVPCDSLQAVRDGFKREYWPFVKRKVAKSNAEATSLREQGNDSYKKAPNNSDHALKLYNQSICMAEEGSEELGMAYANRSAVYFNLQMYRECLQNIKLAKHHNYPERMLKKLNEREERCMKMLPKAEKNSPENENGTKHCTMISCLEISDDTNMIRTSHDLSVGEKVLLEKPFLLVLESEVAYQRCDYCGVQNRQNLRPCKGCTSVMYCSENCQEQALQRYHQFECEIVDDLLLLFRGPKAMRGFQLSLRLFWLGVLLHLEDPENFAERCKNPLELAKYRDPFALEPTDHLLHLFLQGSEELAITREEKAQKNYLTGRCISQFVTILIYVIAVEENKSLTQRIEETVATETLRNLLFVLVYQSERLGDHRLPDMTCFYPFSRLLRHSCAPTAERFLRDLQSVVVLKRPVSKGKEITIAYDEKLTTDRMVKERRQEVCSKEYCIYECNCEGCTSDYPMLDQIADDEQLTEELMQIRAVADKFRKQSELAAFLQRNDNVYPKRELTEAWNIYRKFVMNDLNAI